MAPGSLQRPKRKPAWEEKTKIGRANGAVLRPKRRRLRGRFRGLSGATRAATSRCSVGASRNCLGHATGKKPQRCVSETLDRKCLGDVSCRALDHSLTHDTRLFTPRGVNTLPAHSSAAEASRRNATSARATRKVPKEELSEKVNGCVAAWSERLLERLGGAGRRQIVIV